MLDVIVLFWWQIRNAESEMGNIWDRLFLTLWLLISVGTLLG